MRQRSAHLRPSGTFREGIQLNSMQSTLSVSAIGRLEQIELGEKLTPDQISFGDQSLPADGHGDLGVTAAIVIVSLAAIKALAPLLVRRKERQIITRTDEYTDLQGVHHKNVTEIIIEAAYSEAEVLKALGAATNVDVTSLLDK